MILVYALQTAIPLILILWLAILPPRNLAGFWMLGLAAALMTFTAARLGIWVFPPWWVPYLLALLLVAAVVWRLIRAPQRSLLPSGTFGWLALVLFAGIAGIAGLQSGAAMMASRMPEGPSLDLAWPLGAGTYLVANGGAAASINAHAALLDPAEPLHAGFGGSGYGVDLIAVNGWGLRANGIMPEDPARYRIFGTPVLAPCAGQVVLAEGGRLDVAVPMADEGHPAGNHVLLRCGDRDILLAHFRQGSLRVLMTRGAADAAEAEAAVSAFTAKVKPFSVVGLLATVVLLFGFQGAVILSQPLVIVMIAIPLLIQSDGIFALSYWAAKAWRVPHNVAAPCAMIGTSNFFELAVAVAIGLFGLNSIAALVTVVGVLVEVPVMLTLVWFANRTRAWFPAEETPIRRASKTEKV